MIELRGGSSAARKLTAGEWTAIIGLATVMIASQLMIGGGNNLTALGMTGMYGLTCAALGACRWTPAQPWKPDALAVPGACFAVTLLAALVSISPLRLERVHVVWDLVGGTPGASVDRSATLIEIVKLLGLGCIFLSGFMVGGSVTRARAALKTLTLFASVFGLLAIVTFAAAPTTLMGFGYKALFQDRLTASFLSANTAGTFFGTALLLATGQMLFALRRFGQQRRSGAWAERLIADSLGPTLAILVALTALLLSQSRTAMSATGVTAILLILSEGLVRRWRVRTFVGVLAPVLLFGALATLFIGGGAVLQRLNFLTGDTLVRAHIYRDHASAIRTHPLTGFGLGTFDRVNTSLLQAYRADYADLWMVRAMHNVYLQWIEGAGWLGALPMFGCLAILILTMGVRAGLDRDGSTQLLTLCAISVFVLLHGLTDFALENPSVAGWWSMLLGIGYAMATRTATAPRAAMTLDQAAVKLEPIGDRPDHPIDVVVGTGVRARGILIQMTVGQGQ